MDADLAVFLAVVDTGSFTAAARRVHRTQPAVSAAIARVEAWAGATLLIRGPKGSAVTAAGAALVPHAQAVGAALADGLRAVAEVTDLVRGSVAVGAGAMACATLLPPVLGAFSRAHPGVLVRLVEGNNAALRERLRVGEVDLVVVTADGEEAAGELLAEDRLILVAAPGAERGPVVSFSPGSAVRAILERQWPGVPVAMELGSVSAVRAHVLAGAGPALISERLVQQDVASGRVVVVARAGFPVARHLTIEHRGEARLAPAAAALRRTLLGQRTAWGVSPATP